MSPSVSMNVSAAEKSARVRAMFNQITPRYDFLNRLLSGGLDRAWRRRVVRMAGIGPGGSAVDVCCGTGDLAWLLKKAVGAAGQVVAVDFSECMLAAARRKYGGIEFVQGDALALPLPSASYDAATMAFGLRNLASPADGVAELARVVRPGGRVLVLELTRPRGILRWFYFPYLYVILPLLGGLVSGNFSAYRYLARSIAEFIPPSRILAQMASVGLGAVRATPVCGGIATIFEGTVTA